MSPEPPRAWRRAQIIGVAFLVAGAAAFWGSRKLLHRGDSAEAGRQAYEGGDWAEAAERAREVLKTSPRDLAATRLLARASVRLGRDEAVPRLYARLKPSELEAEDHFLLARMLSRHDRPDLARAELWKAHRKDHAHAEALHELIRLLAQDDSLATAGALAERLAALPGWRVRGEIALGLVRAAQDDPAGAIEALRAALDGRPEREGPPSLPLSVRKLLARHWLSLGQPGKARIALEDLDDSEARWLLARADLQEGKPGDHSPDPARDPLAREPSPYVGTAACARCHMAIARTQRESRHARTFWVGADLDRLPLPEGPVPDPADRAVQHVMRHAGREIQVEARVGERTYEAVLAYAFGSLDRGLTPIARDAHGDWYELRLSHYAEGPAWDRTTGHELRPGEDAEWLGKLLSADELRRCIDCHTTAPRIAWPDAGALAGEHGIGCERCHGPGGNHLKAVAAGLEDLAIARPKLTSGPPIVRLCGACHSPRGRTVSARDPASVRFQATTLTWSRCYTQSNDRLDCVTCHDPHSNVERGAAYYEAKCLDCHGAKASAACPINPQRDCILCHMPSVRDIVPHEPFTFTDHHIRVHSPRPSPVAASSKDRRLQSPGSAGDPRAKESQPASRVPQEPMRKPGEPEKTTMRTTAIHAFFIVCISAITAFG
jgi:hypothetical protein